MPNSIAQCEVGELVRQRIGRARVFEQYGIDYCCGGRHSLEDACRRVGASVDTVCSELERLDGSNADEDDSDWSRMTLSGLAEHIVAKHHAYLVKELPRLADLMDRVIHAHGANHPELTDIRVVFCGLQDELGSHMLKEEQVLFPIVKRLEMAKAESQGRPQFHCGSVHNPIGVMEDEHDLAANALRELRRLTNGFESPDDACETYRALMDGLAHLEQDMHVHIHKENNILFPGAAELEDSLA